MSDCENLPKCPFFFDQMANMPAIATLQKRRFCQGDWALCARYMVFRALGNGKVPGDLFPADLERASQLIEAAS